MRLIDQQFPFGPVLRQSADDGFFGAIRGDGQSQAGSSGSWRKWGLESCLPDREPPTQHPMQESIPTCSATGSSVTSTRCGNPHRNAPHTVGWGDEREGPIASISSTASTLSSVRTIAGFHNGSILGTL